MRDARPVVLFCHSLVSDWNHGNAHFLRGICTALAARGHEVRVFEPRDGWSRTHLAADHGPLPIARFHREYPGLTSRTYTVERLDLDEALDGAGLVLVHEWNDPQLVARIGRHRAAVGGYRLLFHDTHHRAVTDPAAMAAFDLREYDGVLAFGAALRDVYLRRGWAQRVFVWHEAADTRVFRPLPADVGQPGGDLVFIGNWGDDERTDELRRFLLEPVRRLGIAARTYGVRYPPAGLAELRAAGIAHGGFLPNFDVPRVFSRHRVTVHVPRRPYAAALPGIPTIRVFEALACGIPLVCAPWSDEEGLFRPGTDFLVARDTDEMTRSLQLALKDHGTAVHLAFNGLERVRERHTCDVRVDELQEIVSSLGTPLSAPHARDNRQRNAS